LSELAVLAPEVDLPLREVGLARGEALLPRLEVRLLRVEVLHEVLRPLQFRREDPLPLHELGRLCVHLGASGAELGVPGLSVADGLLEAGSLLIESGPLPLQVLRG